MCPTAPFVAELKRVANGVPPAPKPTMGSGTCAVGKDIAAGNYRMKVSAGSNGIYDCLWERTRPPRWHHRKRLPHLRTARALVTVYAGEGSVSKRCGTWTKNGWIHSIPASARSLLSEASRGERLRVELMTSARTCPEMLIRTLT